MHYNFYRVHQTLRVTPTMEAGIADHVWEIEELVALIDLGISHRARSLALLPKLRRLSVAMTTRERRRA
jgi:hypothetical protein